MRIVSAATRAEATKVWNAARTHRVVDAAALGQLRPAIGCRPRPPDQQPELQRRHAMLRRHAPRHLLDAPAGGGDQQAERLFCLLRQ